jgi:hypothetical protein
VWSLDTSSSAPSYNNFLLQPFVNYNLKGGTYLNSVPIITANWEADSGNQWTVPIGAGIGHMFHFGKLPVNMQIGGVLQHHQAGQRPDLSAARTGAVHVPEVAGRDFAIRSGLHA